MPRGNTFAWRIGLMVTATLAATSGCAAPQTPANSQTTDGPTVTSSPSLPYPTAAGGPVDLAHLRDLPPEPALGTPYRYDLYTHCGLELARFGGANWRADTPYDGPLPGYIAGTLELLTNDTARFVVDKRYFQSPLEVVMYHRTTETVPLCK